MTSAPSPSDPNRAPNGWLELAVFLIISLLFIVAAHLVGLFSQLEALAGVPPTQAIWDELTFSSVVLLLATVFFAIRRWRAAESEIKLRNEAQTALKLSEERFRLLTEQVQEYAIYLLDPDGKVASWNLGAQRIKGYRADEIIGQHFSRFYPEADVRAGRPQRALAIAVAEHLYHEEGIRVRKDGTEFTADVTITALFDDKGKLRGFSKVTRDITERKQEQEALRLSENRFRGLIENSADGIVLFSLDGLVSYVGPSTVTILGYEPIQMIGHSAMEFIHPDDQDLFVTTMTSLVREPEKRITQESRIRHADGRWRWLEGTLTNLLNDPSVGAVVNNYRDVTERKQRRQQLEATAALSAAMRTVDNPANMLSVILAQLLKLLEAECAAIDLMNVQSGQLATEVSIGPWQAVAEAANGGLSNLTESILKNGGIYRSDPQPGDGEPRQALLGAPLTASQQIIGVVRLTRRLAFEPEEGQMLQTLAEIASNAIHRTRLYEQTQRALRHRAALSDIDRAIMGSFDLKLSLNTVLQHVQEELEAAAADILTFNATLQTLNFVAGRGFQLRVPTNVQLRLGEGYAGRAAFERRLLHVADLAEQKDNMRLQELVAVEHFTDYYAVPLIAKGQIKGVLEVFLRGTSDNQPQDWLEFLKALAGQAAIAIDNATLFDGMQRSNIELGLAYDATIEGWSRALDLRDNETEGHTQRVTEMTLQVARAAGFSQEQLVHVRRGALLHDIGKMGVPDAILLKPGPLTDEEWVIMRQHTTYAYELLYPIAYLRPALDIPYYHHERWDGTGYPNKLKGEQIPFAARLFAPVDVWDALRSERPYRKPWPDEKVRAYIQSLAGSHFDPRAVEIFNSIGSS